MPPLPRDSVLGRLPPPWPEELLPTIRAAVEASGRTVVVLDDDPTGTQTVYDVLVLTEWPTAALRDALAERPAALFLLTNSRSLPLAEAARVGRAIGRALAEIAEGGDLPAIVSRSDSTLRGHFPGEVMALAAALGRQFDAAILVPAFFEGGRITVGDTHYVAEGDTLVPAGETPFARDATFGYRASDLRAWVEEKTGGRVRAGDVASITIDDLRRGGPARVAELLTALEGGRVCVVNAAEPRDMEVLVAALLDAEARGKRFVFRTAASFVQTRAGLAPRPLLAPAELALPAGGGLTVVGSYVPKTTAQLDALLQAGAEKLAPIEVSVEALLDPARRGGEVARAAGEAAAALRAGRDTVVYTARGLVTGDDAEASLAIGREVSAGLGAIVRAVVGEVRPRYILAKGGITSSDIATKGLGARRARVRGQLLPGVPVWQLGDESLLPGLTYVVFPGNVGGDAALSEAVRKLGQE